ncbi:DUF3726 domain-containing protein [Pseudomonas sp. JH-2]|uniref:DUF3726 domain-containing protein n=1 Tax=Pseudomonas sp. JH-2 TaxID=3114998 RepID=UPI002E26D513|nr:DUF3726 domain-containing protein [Pseudomonas sp. JH-2]
MRVAFNEVQVLCRKAFEGLGLDPGDGEDAAQMVAWAQLHGLDGLGALARGLSFMESDAQRPVELCYEDDGQVLLDAGGQSVLRSAVLALELGAAKAMRSGAASVRIRRCHNRILLLAHLAGCARRGLNVCAYWRDTRQEAVVSFAAGQGCPRLSVYRLPAGSRDDEQSLNILLSQYFQLSQRVPEGALLIDRDADNLAETAERQLSEGIEVDPQVWDTLKRLGERVLVESTEASRLRGAGEGSESILQQMNGKSA